MTEQDLQKLVLDVLSGVEKDLAKASSMVEKGKKKLATGSQLDDTAHSRLATVSAASQLCAETLALWAKLQLKETAASRRAFMSRIETLESGYTAKARRAAAKLKK